MTPEEEEQSGKYSDAYQREYALCFVIAMVAGIVFAAVMTIRG